MARAFAFDLGLGLGLGSGLGLGLVPCRLCRPSTPLEPASECVRTMHSATKRRVTTARAVRALAIYIQYVALISPYLK